MSKIKITIETSDDINNTFLISTNIDTVITTPGASIEFLYLVKKLANHCFVSKFKKGNFEKDFSIVTVSTCSVPGL